MGRWDAAGEKYIGGEGHLILKTQAGKIVATGTRIANNLYKLKLTTQNSNPNFTDKSTEYQQIFHTREPTQSWQTWHRRFGHISYSGLQKLPDNWMVDSLTIDLNMSKPVCEACVQAKQTIEPFNQTSQCITKPGDLTHIDLWGKYKIISINKNQYYILFVDDASRYVTVFF